MPLQSGARLGTYEVLGPLGAGGMGTVYRARDTRLNRQVAIKTLSDTYALTPDRVARFEREAQLLAALNHPHIARRSGRARCENLCVSRGDFLNASPSCGDAVLEARRSPAGRSAPGGT